MQGVDQQLLNDLSTGGDTAESEEEDLDDDEDGHGRQLYHNINWARSKYASPVKNQGGCGSCWAFAATSAQEVKQAIKRDTSAIRLSEQEALDCDKRSGGCHGGHPSTYWTMSNEIGSQAYTDYPYES